jgi:hypothetical protein
MRNRTPGVLTWASGFAPCVDLGYRCGPARMYRHPKPKSHTGAIPRARGGIQRCLLVGIASRRPATVPTQTQGPDRLLFRSRPPRLFAGIDPLRRGLGATSPKEAQFDVPRNALARSSHSMSAVFGPPEWVPYFNSICTASGQGSISKIGLKAGHVGLIFMCVVRAPACALDTSYSP